MTTETERPASAESDAESRANSGFRSFMSEILEADRRVFHAETSDAATTRGQVGQGVLSRLDTAVRGRRYDGKFTTRMSRILVNLGIGIAATEIDTVTSRVERSRLGRSRFGWIVVTAVEYAEDKLLKTGADWIGSRLTGVPDFHYASKLSENLSNVLNLFPVGRQYVNSVNVEAAWRTGYNLPVFGGLVEKAYRAGNRFLDMVDEKSGLRWSRDLFMNMIRARMAQRHHARASAAA